MADDVPIDIWSGLDHKAGMGATEGGLDPSPDWLDDAAKRRLNFYARAKAYLETVAREFLPAAENGEEDPKSGWREYGDAGVMVARIASAVIGEDAIIAVDGADEPVPDQPPLPPAPTPPEPVEGEDPSITQVKEAAYQEALAIWGERAETAVELWVQRASDLPKLQERERWIQDWADSEEFLAKVTEAEEEHIVPLGSGVYVFGWNADKARPTVEIYEPDVYHPVLDDARPSVFPRKVHLAWGFVELEGEEEVEKVRRITYELVRVDGQVVEGEETGDVPADFGPAPAYLADGQSHIDSCLMTDVVFRAEDFETIDFEGSGEFSVMIIDGVEVPMDRYPIGLDFIPIVHVPNTLASITHFGRSALGRLFQILDEVAQSDVDEALASRWAAQPPIALSGMNPGDDAIDIRPGRGVKLGVNGRLDTIDMAQNLEKLGDRLDRILKRLAVNGEVPEGLLGRVDASQVPSGLALAMSFTSFEQKIEKARMARGQKYPLCLKMVQRIAVANGDESLNGATEVYPAQLRFGSFMPQDMVQIASVIRDLREVKVLSQETAIRMAQDAGVPAPDVAEEVRSIQASDAETADMLTAALEDPKYAADYLGIEGYGVDDGLDPEGAPVEIPQGGAEGF